MIQEVKCYTCLCDGCGASFCDEDREGFTIFADESQLTDAMDNADWHLTYDGTNKHYCRDCHEINDNDELILKGKALTPPAL